METINANKLKIEKLQKEINFIESNLKKLEDMNIEYRVVNLDNKYLISIDINDFNEVDNIIKAYAPSKDIKNNIRSASSKEWLNNSPFLIKTEKYSNKYSHLRHNFKVSYYINDSFEISLNIDIKTNNIINTTIQATKETAHYKRESMKKYETICTLNSNLPYVKFYGDSYYYYSENEEQNKIIKSILNIK